MTKTNHTLPPPTEPHPDWSRLIQALWDHGRLHPDPALVARHIGNVGLVANLVGAFEERTDEPPRIRPSSLLSCARQSYLFLKGYDPEPMPRGLSITFGIGHFVEAAGRVYLMGALPPGFEMTVNTQEPLPAWWPTEHPRFADKGSNDFKIWVSDPGLAAAYLDLNRAKMLCVGDFKTASSFQVRRAADLADKPDGFGYLAQVATYGAGQPQPCDTVLAVFNRNSPSQGLAARLVSPGTRGSEEYRIQRAFQCALTGRDPGREFLDRWGKAGQFYCDKQRGYCPMKEVCAETEVAEPLEV